MIDEFSSNHQLRKLTILPLSIDSKNKREQQPIKFNLQGYWYSALPSGQAKEIDFLNHCEFNLTKHVRPNWGVERGKQVAWVAEFEVNNANETCQAQMAWYTSNLDAKKIRLVYELDDNNNLTVKSSRRNQSTKQQCSNNEKINCFEWEVGRSNDSRHLSNAGGNSSDISLPISALSMLHGNNLEPYKFTIGNVVVSKPDTNNCLHYTSPTTKIKTAQEFLSISGNDNYCITEDLDFSGVNITTPHLIDKITGNLSGADKAPGVPVNLKNINIHSPNSAVSLVGSLVNNAQLINIHIDNSSFKGKYAAGLVTKTSGTALVTSSGISSSTIITAPKAAGLIFSTDRGIIGNSYFNGSISGNEVAGLLYLQGNSDQAIYYSYSLAGLNGTNNYGLIAKIYGSGITCENSYWLQRAGSQTIIDTMQQMLNSNTYQNWDFDRIWRIEKGTYPTLKVNQQQ